MSADSGRHTERDPETGRIISASLDPEVAREMGKKRWTGEIDEKVNALLSEAGYDDLEAAPEAIKLLARQAVTARSSSVAALRYFLRLTSGDEPEQVAVKAKLKPGDICDRCGSMVLDERTLVILREALQGLAESTREVEKSDSGVTTGG